jgi:hypothetical protein
MCFSNPYEEGRKQAEALLNSGLYELAEESRTGYVYGDHPFDRMIRRAHLIDELTNLAIATTSIVTFAWLILRRKR